MGGVSRPFGERARKRRSRPVSHRNLRLAICDLRCGWLKNIKRLGWWGFGFLLITLFVIALVARDRRDPFDVIVESSTNRISAGTTLLTLMLSNRTERALRARATCEMLSGGQWTSGRIVGIDSKSGFPVPL